MTPFSRLSAFCIVLRLMLIYSYNLPLFLYSPHLYHRRRDISIMSSNKLKHYWAVHPVAHGGKLGEVISGLVLPVIVIVIMEVITLGGMEIMVEIMEMAAAAVV